MKPLDTKLYPVLIWSSSALFAASGCALLVLMLANIIGPFRFLGDAPIDPGGDAIALWIAGAPEEPGAARRLEAWRRGLAPDQQVVELDHLRELTATEARTLVIPDARAMTIDQAAAVETLLDAGFGVVVSGAIGVRAADGGWRGYELMEQLLGVPVTSLEVEAASRVMAWRRGPLSAPLSPGQRIRLRAEPGVAAVVDPGSELRWSGAAQRATSGGASRRVERGRGRLVWLAVDPERALDGRADDWRATVEILGASVAWAGRRPRVEVMAWPNGAPFAGSPDARLGDPSSAGDPSKALAARLHAELARAETVGGVAHLSVGPMKSLEAELFAQLERRGAWIAETAEVARWRRAHGGVSAAVAQTGPSRLRIDVTNRAPQDVRGVALRVYLNRRVADASVGATLVGQSVPDLKFDPAQEWVDLRLPALPGQGHETYHLDFVAPAT